MSVCVCVCADVVRLAQEGLPVRHVGAPRVHAVVGGERLHKLLAGLKHAASLGGRIWHERRGTRRGTLNAWMHIASPTLAPPPSLPPSLSYVGIFTRQLSLVPKAIISCLCSLMSLFEDRENSIIDIGSGIQNRMSFHSMESIHNATTKCHRIVAMVSQLNSLPAQACCRSTRYVSQTCILAPRFTPS